MATHGIDLNDPLDRLLLEGIPSRPTPADPLRMAMGPTEQFRRLELARLAWALSRCAEPEVGAA